MLRAGVSLFTQLLLYKIDGPQLFTLGSYTARSDKVHGFNGTEGA